MIHFRTLFKSVTKIDLESLCDGLDVDVHVDKSDQRFYKDQ